MNLISIEPSSRKEKRLVALFSNGVVVHFGLKGGNTFIDHHDPKKREAYIARHQVLEDWKDPTKAGTLSRYILWEKKTLKEAIRAFKERFDI